MACEQIGFFIIKGHGIPVETVNQACAIAQQFFDLPLEVKQKSSVQGSGSGYLPMEGENLAATLGVNAPSDLKESFNISSRKEKNSWPDLPDFETVCTNYFDNMVKLASVIMEIFARALELSVDYFDSYITPPNAILRFVNYPQLTKQPSSQQLRCAPHTDYGTLTIVRPDSPGLQARDRRGIWIDVDTQPDSFVVNIGDMMQRWTNDTWISTLHQVINPVDDSNCRRQSVVFFHNPCDDAVISCLPTCFSEEYPQLYEPITAGEHRQQKSQKSRPNL
jgi:isopenicillin N synthase-like dioxygenase